MGASLPDHQKWLTMPLIKLLYSVFYKLYYMYSCLVFMTGTISFIYIPHLAIFYQHLLSLKFLQRHSGPDMLQHVVVYTNAIYVYNNKYKLQYVMLLTIQELVSILL